MRRNFFYTIELILYFGGLSIVFIIDWKYGIATVMMILGDNIKTRRMMKEEKKK